MKHFISFLIASFCFTANAGIFDYSFASTAYNTASIYIRFGQPSSSTGDTVHSDPVDTSSLCTGQGVCQSFSSAAFGDFEMVPADLICVSKYVEGKLTYELSLEMSLDVIALLGGAEATQTTYFFETGTRYTFYGGIHLDDKTKYRLGLPMSTPEIGPITIEIPVPNDMNILTMKLGTFSVDISDFRSIPR